MLGSFVRYVGRWLYMAICMVLSAFILLIMFPVSALVGTGKAIWQFLKMYETPKWDGVDRRKKRRPQETISTD